MSSRIRSRVPRVQAARQRQLGHAGGRKPDVAHAARRHAGCPFRHDRDAELRGHEIDDGLLFIGDLDDARLESGSRQTNFMVRSWLCGRDRRSVQSAADRRGRRW